MPSNVRPATHEDLDAIARIYAHAVRTSVATFDLDDPPREYWSAKVDGPDHTLVVEEAPAGVVGYAYSSSFRPRPAYANTRETSVYLAPEAVGRGLGTTLYRSLFDLLRADGIHLAVAVVALPNPASVALHERLGFELVGTLREVGRKFDRWVDTSWYQLLL
jgi:phosphinothricin acetyltransferase